MEHPDARRVWDIALGQLQLQVTRPNYDTWLRHTVGLAAENGTFIIGTPSPFVSEWLSEKMQPVIDHTVSTLVHHQVSVCFRVVAAPPSGNGQRLEPSPLEPGDCPTPPEAAPSRHTAATTRFTFSHFVVGDSNRLAAAAALAAADHPAQIYNPLIMCGGTGLGKTHLLRAIANRTMSSQRHVICTTSEQFTNEFVNSIDQHTQDSFRRKYRSAEVLLIDDIQFLSGKERTQEEFFHTFNELHGAACQLVFTCDRPPGALTGLQRRLCSRFQGGLVADIQPPDHTTRLAILQAKAREQGTPVSPDVAQLIADRAQESIRELEGLLNRVTAYARLTRAAISIQVARDALNALTPHTTPSPPTPEAIIERVARYFNTSPQALTGPSRVKQIAEARHMAMYLLREDAQLPLKAIGRALGNRDHSTVIHGCRKASTWLNDNTRRHQLDELRAYIRA
jgi:chromosomal replication initiator protein